MSAIPIAVPSFVPKAISLLSADVVISVLSTLEAGFYGAIKGGSANVSRVVKWIRTHSIEQIHAIQLIFNGINVAIILHYTAHLVPILKNNYALLQAGSSLLLGCTSIGLAFALSGLVLSRIRASATSDQTSFQQGISKKVHGAKLILNLALVILSANRFWFALQLLGSTYSMIKNDQIKWTPLRMDTHNASAVYRALETPIDPAAQAELCTICLDDERPAEVAFCTNHVFHRDCFRGYLNTQTHRLLQGARYTRIATRHYRNGHYTGTSISYTATLPQGSLPACPNCREVPRQNSIEINVEGYSASVTVTGRRSQQPLFETLYAGYSVAQAGLAFLQQYPELAATILTVQKLLLVVDIAGLAISASYLYSRVKERLNAENSTAFKIAAALTAIATIGLAYLAVSQLQAIMKSSLLLKEALQGLAIAPNTQINWGFPELFGIMQTVYLTRIVTTFALAFFSNQKWTNFISAFAQALSFTGITYNLRWLEISQMLKNPFNSQDTQVTSQYFIHRSCTLNPTHLRSTLRSIYNHTANIFSNASWDWFWNVTYRNGVEAGRRLVYEVTLKNQAIWPCDCTLVPQLSRISASNANIILK